MPLISTSEFPVSSVWCGVSWGEKKAGGGGSVADFFLRIKGTGLVQTSSSSQYKHHMSFENVNQV